MLLQRYSRGYMTHKKYKNILHRAIIDRMMDHFHREKERLGLDLKIKLWFAWKLKKRRKAIKAAKKKAKAEADKKKGYRGSTRKTTTKAAVAISPVKPPPKPAAKPVAAAATTSDKLGVTSKTEANSPVKVESSPMKQP